jgi:predicted nucleic acid-binding protein
MLVVDSSAWIEILRETPIGLVLVEHLPTREQCVVPTIVQFELAKWLARELGETEANRFLTYTLKCQVVELTTKLAISAATLSSRHRLAMADAIIYATALDQQAELLTCDAHFENLPHIRYFQKRG